MTPISDFLSTMRGTEASSVDGGTRLFGFAIEGVRVGFRLLSETGALLELVFVPHDSGDLSPAAVRALPLGRLVATARDTLTRERLEATDDVLATPSKNRLAPFLTPRNGVPLSDANFAGLALEYMWLVQDGERAPARVLSERYGGGSASQWSNRVGEARRRGLLEPTKQGKRGADLTDKARTLLGHDDTDTD